MPTPTPVQDQYISSHFLYSDVTRSSTADRLGIDNSLEPSLIPAVYNTAAHMELVRTVLQTPILVDSWARCLKLNRVLKSKDTSQHVKGEAVDFISPKYGTPESICKILDEHFSLIQFDQLIFEHSWVHIAFQSSPTIKPRGQVLTLLEDGDYGAGITDKKGNPL